MTYVSARYYAGFLFGGMKNDETNRIAVDCQR